MTNHRQTIDLPYRPEDLFELASDVGRYPDFIHWIQSMKLLSEQEDEAGMHCRAEVTVGFKGFRESFITDVDAKRAERAIEVKLVRGPFKKLANTWTFQPIPTGTRVDFFITFEFRNFVLQALADANKAFAIGRIIDAFVSEAGRRYQKVKTTA